MKGTVFSRRLVLVYTLIVMIPLAVLIIIVTESFRAGEYEKLTGSAQKKLDDYADHIADCFNIVYRLESLIAGNNGIADLFLFTDLDDTLPVIRQTRATSDELERLLASLPLIYGIRIFVSDRRIPERWPIFFHTYRLPPSGETWDYHFYTSLMGELETGEPLVAFSSELLFSKRRLGQLQILMQAAEFFSFLFWEDDPVYRNFVFHRGFQADYPSNTDTGVLNPTTAYRILATAEKTPGGTLSSKEGGITHIYVWRFVPGTELLLVRECSTAEIQEGIALFRFAAGFGIIGSTVLLFFIIRFATQKMMARLYIIMDGMREVRKGNLDISLSTGGSDEITDMAEIFTDMVGRIKTLIAEIAREQQLLTDTEIRVMQNQINAHFLYNVLESIKMQAELHNDPSIVQSITLLGKMLRYCLRRNTPRVKLREELEYIHSYIALLNIRNDYRIQIDINAEDPCLDHEIPKMLIQPVIENAFLHAIEPQGEDAVIGLGAKADTEKGILWISVKDSGSGMGREKREELAALLAEPRIEERSGGIGLSNIQERLIVLYGSSWKIHIDSEEGRGTEVIIPIPLKLPGEVQCRVS